MTKKKLMNIQHIDSTDVLLLYYHELLYKFMKESAFTPDKHLLELYCKLNPGYNILNGTGDSDKSNLIKLHEEHLRDFYKFNMISRFGEILQNYTDKIFRFPKHVEENMGSYTSNLYLLKGINLDDVEITSCPSVTQTNYDIIERFCTWIMKNIYVSDNQMGEIFDTFVYDMYSSFQLLSNTEMNAHKEHVLVELKPSQYLILMKWLLSHVEDSYSRSQRDFSRFYQLLMVYIWMHHTEVLIGGKRVGGNVKWRDVDHTVETDPRYFLRNPHTLNVQEDWKYYGHYSFFQNKTGKRLYNKMSFHGDMSNISAVCSRQGILPTPNEKRIANNSLVSFLAIQEYLYKVTYEDCENGEISRCN